MNIQYPKNEYIVLTYSNEDSIPKYVITRTNRYDGVYKLYNVNQNGTLKYKKQSNTPTFKEVY